MLFNVQGWKDKFAIVETEIRRPTHGPRPRTEPLPERTLGMRLEPPLAAHMQSVMARPRCRMQTVLIVFEEHAEHIHIAQTAQGLRGGTELDIIIRGGRRGA